MATRKEMKALTYANHPSTVARLSRIQIRGTTINGYYLADRSRVLYDVPADLVSDFERSHHFQNGVLVAYAQEETPVQKTRRRAKAVSEPEAPAETEDSGE